MKLNRVAYGELNSKQKEIYNFQKVASVFADYGFNCIKLSDDWQSADFLAYHKDGDYTLKIQLKGRMLVEKRYIGKNLHMCFRIGGIWYLVPHDDLIRIVGEVSPATFKTVSWERGTYSWPRPPKPILEKLNDYALEPNIKS